MPITIKNSAGGGVTLDSTTSNNETVNLPTGGGTLVGTATPSFTGNATITSGNLVIATAGKGLAVGGTGAANTLDDYEEGTFTLGGTGIDTGNSIGIYTKIGRMCHTQMWIRADGNTDGTITGLPFAAGTGSANFIGVGTIGYINGSVTGVVGNGATTTFVMYNGTSTGSMSNGNQMHLGYAYTTT